MAQIITQLTTRGRQISNTRWADTRYGPYLNSVGALTALCPKRDSSGIPAVDTIDIDISTDGGASFSIASTRTWTDFGFVTSNNTVVTTWDGSAACYKNDKWYVFAAGALTISGSPGSYSDDPRGAVHVYDTVAGTWSILLAAASGYQVRSLTNGLGIVIKSNGDVVLAFENVPSFPVNSTPQLGVYTAASFTWGVAISVPFTGSDTDTDNMLVGLMLTASDRVRIFGIHGSNNQANQGLYHICWNNAATFGTEQLIASDFTPGCIGQGAAYVDGSSVECIIVPYMNIGSGFSYYPGPTQQQYALHALDTDSPTWTSQTIEDSADVGYGSPLSFTENPCGVAVAGGVPYLFYCTNPGRTSTSGDIRRSQYNGTSWATPITFLSVVAAATSPQEFGPRAVTPLGADKICFGLNVAFPNLDKHYYLYQSTSGRYTYSYSPSLGARSRTAKT